MSQNTLPSISQQELNAVADKPDEFILLLVNRYHDILASDQSGQIQHEFTAEQNILLAFNILDEQVSSGGFIQLIENGYGPYIFDTPLSSYLNEWGLVKTSSLIDQARVLYTEKKDMLEKEKTLEEFAKLYQQHPEFDPLDAEFSSLIGGERYIVAKYICDHLDRFALPS